MKITQKNLTGLCLAIVLACCSVTVYSAESEEDSYLNKDQVNGRMEQTKGKVKEVTGKIIGDKQMELEGNVQKNVGKVQAGYGDIKKDIKEGK
jgi:uncharacterized protein YjbJ (UPF0337 family)